MAVVATDNIDETDTVKLNYNLDPRPIQVDHGYWSKSERKQWMIGLMAGTTFLYAARTIMTICVVPLSDELKWDKTESGTVLSSFFWGYAMTQILGGYISDRVGGDIVLPIAACVWSFFTFLTPQLVYLSSDKTTGIRIVVASRVILGCSQGFHCPGLSSMISRKVRECDRSLTYSIVSSGTYIGTLLTGCLGSIFLDSFGWQVTFQFIGFLGISWVLFMQYSLIPKNRRITLSWKSFSLSFKKDSSSCETAPSVPWLTLFTKPAFWSLLVGHFCDNYAFFILLSWMPTYFHENFPEAKGWIFNVVPWLISIPMSIGSGFLADTMINNGFTVTMTRKIIESVALLGTGSCLFLITWVDSYEACLTCLAISVACCGFHASGISVNPQDIAPKHAGSVYGVMNMCGAIPGFIGVYIAGYVLETTKSWDAVFSQTAFVCIVGWVVYVIFGTGRKII